MRAGLVRAAKRWAVAAGAASAGWLGAGVAAGQTAPEAAPALVAVPVPAPAPAAAPSPIDLELGAVLGISERIGDGPGFEIVERAGPAYGVSAFVTLEPAFSIGLAFEHVDLGRERSAAGGLGAIEVTRDLNTLWASVRINLVRGAAGELGLSFGPGLAWQSADAAGVLFPTSGGVPFSCSASASADIALRAGLGGALALGGGLYLTGGVTIDNVRLASEPLDDCVLGAGSATLLGARAGFAYRFDVGRYVR